MTAVGRAVAQDGTPVAAISVSLPTVRFNQDRLPELAAALAVTAADIERDLARSAATPG